MGSSLPAITPEAFAEALRRLAPEALTDASCAALYAHYLELERWNPRLSLVGPGTAGELLSRHFGESLAALPLIPQRGTLLDIGSGGGFPGLVLAAVRPGLRVILVEPRQRKWAFLQAAARRAALSVEVVDARVDLPLPAIVPAELERVTSRAVALAPALLAALAGRLRPEGAVLLWAGAAGPVLPPGLAVRDEVPLAGSERRRILAVGAMEGTR